MGDTVVPTFQRESITDELLSDILPLMVGNYSETGIFQDLDLSPDFDTYRTVEGLDMLRVFTIRESGKLVGYSIFIVSKHTHFKDFIVAKEEVIYISPDSRHGSTGLRFMKYCDELLAKEPEINLILRSSTEIRDIGILLEKNGYELCDKIYGRRIN